MIIRTIIRSITGQDTLADMTMRTTDGVGIAHTWKDNRGVGPERIIIEILVTLEDHEKLPERSYGEDEKD
jgi:hypothetical protein